MYKLMSLLFVATLFLVSVTAKPQVLVDTYGYYAAPAYVASYSTPLAYTYPYAYAPVENVDLQLPKCDKELPPPPVVVEPEVIQFKEKRVESLGDGPVVFKKRKFNNPKRNMRQKLDDE